ncbi:hypothetical protein B4114_1161 [Geobacillus stearothermophilus]|uniref:Uncharacterized protein n=1 Tax=Geobacillus stearothermophilus TaxID=1422 RepID=A0A150NBK5_GEOSE|nr:hypothetical protein B4114_1161 [Geobacillus stearothermophilus]
MFYSPNGGDFLFSRAWGGERQSCGERNKQRMMERRWSHVSTARRRPLDGTD